MSEIVLHKAIVEPSLALAATSLPGWVGPLLVTVLGLALLGFYLRRLSFTPVEEAVLVPEARSLREAPRAGAVSAAPPEAAPFLTPDLKRSWDSLRSLTSGNLVVQRDVAVMHGRDCGRSRWLHHWYPR